MLSERRAAGIDIPRDGDIVPPLGRVQNRGVRMNTVARGRGGRARGLSALLAVTCAVSSGCLVISWDWSGRKHQPEEHTIVYRSSSSAVYDADPSTVRQACVHALNGMQLPITAEVQDGPSATIQAGHKDKEKDKVTIELINDGHATLRPGVRTAVCVKMTSTGPSDGSESRQILQRVEAYLAGAAAAGPQLVPPVMPASATGP
jgi:hypothetical protein